MNKNRINYVSVISLILPCPILSKKTINKNLNQVLEIWPSWDFVRIVITWLQEQFLHSLREKNLCWKSALYNHTQQPSSGHNSGSWNFQLCFFYQSSGQDLFPAQCLNVSSVKISKQKATNTIIFWKWITWYRKRQKVSFGGEQIIIQIDRNIRWIGE